MGSDIPTAQMINGQVLAPKTSFARHVCVAAILAISIGAVYGPSLAVPFIYDDQASIVENDSIISLGPPLGTPDHPGPLSPRQDLPTTARPLVNLSFAINYYFGGLNPIGYHAVNVAIHFLSSLLLWAIVRRTLCLPNFAGRYESSAGWLALAVAMLWAMHPLVTEAVIYATQRTELAFAFFYLATLYCSLRYWSLPSLSEVRRSEGALEGLTTRRARATWLACAVVACLAGMASKEVMASAPLLVLLFERTFIAGSLRKALQRSWPLYVGLASTWILLAVLSRNQPHLGSAGFGLVPLGSWWLTQTHVIWIYLKLAVWPSPLLIHYDLPYLTSFTDASLYVVPTLIVGIVMLLLLWRNNPIGFLGTCVFAILSPTSLVPIPSEMAAERRMYLPLAALAALFVVGGFRAIQSLSQWSSTPQKKSFWPRESQGAIVVATLAIVIACGLTSAQRLTDYRDEIKLWRQLSTFAPHDYVARDTLGHLLLKSGRVPEAIEEFQTALALKPDHPDALNNLGQAFLTSKRVPEAVDKFQAALALEPEFGLAHNNLGVAFRELGRLPESIEHLEQARELQPKLFLVRINLGRSLLLAGRLPEAVNELQSALALKPNDVTALTNLALAHSQMGQPTQAIASAEKAIELGHSTGQDAAAEQLEDWLKNYRAELQRNGAPLSTP